MKKCIVILLLVTATTLKAQTSFSLNIEGIPTDKAFEKHVEKNNYQLISAFDTVSKQPLLIYALYMKDNKWGILDINGNSITKPIYDEIPGLDKNRNSQKGFNKYYIVKKDGKYGTITNLGKEAIKPKFEKLYVEKTDSIYTAYQNNKEVYLNIRGEIINHHEEEYSPKYGNASSANTIKRNSKQTEYTVTNNSINKTYIVPNFGNLSRVLTNGNFLFEKDKKFGVYDPEKKKFILPVEYNELRELKDGYIVSKNKLQGLAKADGTIVIPIQYQTLNNLGNVYLVGNDGKYGFYSNDYKRVSECKYENLTSTGSHNIILSLNGKTGLLDGFGNPLSPFIYDRLQSDSSMDRDKDFVIYAYKDGKVGIMDQKGNLVVPIEYEMILSDCSVSPEQYSLQAEEMMMCNQKNNFFYFKKDDKYGILSNDYKVIINNDYENMLESMIRWHVYVQKNKKWGLLDVKTNKIIIPIEYDRGIKFEWSSFYKVSKDRKYGLYDKFGKLLIAVSGPNFLINQTFNGLIRVDEIKGDSYYLDCRGQKVVVGKGPVPQSQFE